MARRDDGNVEVARLINAPASVIFGVLADPARHTELDGSAMLRGHGSSAIISGVGDVFIMKMYFAPIGDYEMNNEIVEYEPDRLVGWEPVDGRGHPDEGSRAGHRWSFELSPAGPDATIVTHRYDCRRVSQEMRTDMDNGNCWLDDMATTLERLDELCTRPI